MSCVNMILLVPLLLVMMMMMMDGRTNEWMSDG